MTDIEIFNGQPVSGFDSGGVVIFASSSLVLEETYKVIWDGDEYICDAYMADILIEGMPVPMVLIGNQELVEWNYSGQAGEMPSIVEPFIINAIPAELAGADCMLSLQCASQMVGACSLNSHTVVIYQSEKEEEKEETEDGIVIRNPNGQKVVYGDYKKIRINKNSGAKVIYTQGEIVDQVEVNLNFGDEEYQTIVADDGYSIKSVIIKRPSDLKSENIVKNAEIAGVAGEHECSGGGSFDTSDPNLQYFVYQLDNDAKTITLHAVLHQKLYKDTGSYDLVIPDTFGGYSVLINSEGVSG